VLACAAVSVAALLAPGAASAAGWLPISPAAKGNAGNSVSFPKVAVDDAGNVYAAWIENTFLEVSKRPVGGVFEQPQTLDSGVAAANADIAVDGAGNAVVVWRASAFTPTVKQARRAAGASSFGAPVPVPVPSGSSGDNPKVAVNRAGEAVLALATKVNTNAIVRVFLGTSTTDFVANTASQFKDYDEGSNSFVYPPDVAINEAGDAAIAWRSTDDTSQIRIDAGYRVRGVAGFGNIENVTSDLLTKHEPSVAIDSQGVALTAWDEDSMTQGHVTSYYRPGVASWAKVNDLDPPQQGNAFPHVAFDLSTYAVAAWAFGGAVRDSTRPPGGQFSQPPQSLTGTTQQPFDLALDAGPPGTIVLTWASPVGSAVRAAVRPNAGVFGQVTQLSPLGHGGDSTDVAVDAQGNAAAVWVDTNPPGANPQIVTAEYDATAPSFTATSVPDTAILGQPAAMSASASDDWSATTISWDFGDGKIAFGGATSHTYTAEGTYTVTGYAMDAAGNIASFTHAVSVLDVPTRGVDFNASAVSGTVFVSLPRNAPAGRVLARPAVARGAAAIKPPKGYRPFRRLRMDDNIPVGSILDATKGTSRVKMATNASGTKTQGGKFSGGVFKTKQSRGSSLTTAVMMGGGNFRRDCRKFGFLAKVHAARKRPRRRLFGNVKGRFRTRGRHSTATVRGTEYVVKDECKGTTTRVLKGSVKVRDEVKHRTRIVRAGHSYLARSRRR
jgi:hypothetical protein